LSESYSFIWHPKVRMKTFLVGFTVEGADLRLGPDLRDRIE
jgi:hypothetical protein